MSDRQEEFRTRQEWVDTLREEARYWRREAMKWRKRGAQAVQRASDIDRPVVTIEQGESSAYFRVFVNGVGIDGYETREVAETVQRRLVEAFALGKKT